MDRDIRQELYLAVLLLGADTMLLGAIERMEDGELLDDLRNWNEARLAELKEWLPTMGGEALEDAQRRIAQYEDQRRSLKLAA
jgi:hypothetical protein